MALYVEAWRVGSGLVCDHLAFGLYQRRKEGVSEPVMDKPTNLAAASLVEASSQPLGVQLVNTNKTNKMHDITDIVELAKTVQQADEFIRANACNKLTVIAEQIHYLQEQAKKTLQDAKRDHELHHAACNLVKRPGAVYYLYKRQSGQTYFSLLAPQEWGPSCPHEFLGAYKLEYDQSWTPFDQIEKRGDEIALMDKILNSQLAIEDSHGFSGLDARAQPRARVEEVTSEGSMQGQGKGQSEIKS